MKVVLERNLLNASFGILYKLNAMKQKQKFQNEQKFCEAK